MIKNKPLKVELLTLETMLTVIKKSVGTKMFQTIYAKVNGQKKDITAGGDLSCAFYVSSILAFSGFIDRAHSTVTGTVAAMKQDGWVATKKLEPGVVIVWGPNPTHAHDHIGFYLGNDKAASNIREKKVPGIHHVTFGSVKNKTHRSILGLYRHPKLK